MVALTQEERARAWAGGDTVRLLSSCVLQQHVVAFRAGRQAQRRLRQVLDVAQRVCGLQRECHLLLVPFHRTLHHKCAHRPRRSLRQLAADERHPLVGVEHLQADSLAELGAHGQGGRQTRVRGCVTRRVPQRRHGLRVVRGRDIELVAAEGTRRVRAVERGVTPQGLSTPRACASVPLANARVGA